MMMSCSTTCIIRQNWQSLANGLDVFEAVEKLKQDLAFNITGYPGVFQQLLQEWKSKNGEKATVQALYDVFVSQCKWNDLAGRKILALKLISF